MISMEINCTEADQSKVEQMNVSTPDEAFLALLNRVWRATRLVFFFLFDSDIRIGLCLRLGFQVGSEYKCLCGTDLSLLSYNGFHCRLGSCRQSRHSAMNDPILWLFVSESQHPSRQKPVGLVEGNNFRPEGYTLLDHWGRTLARDVILPPYTLADRCITGKR
ncbi:hypothetical protein HELRODRAFT_179791 [Helobdella robusta]|uniref:Uncharacterized protein n=1 Tax=Helobdella robusta TaxID=6412 RepID=T1FF59_HELRO|nr:hypothetical protein HELRODRAFT_179791 [Helobdella robusta]ESN94953.1 hypothetical protein HELRODRAFT_179791 [Helobdella robusta]